MHKQRKISLDGFSCVATRKDNCYESSTSIRVDSCLQRKEFIRDSVNAALEQRDVAVEVIVIDDGSTDERHKYWRIWG